MAILFALRVFARNLHTYIHNWPLLPFSQKHGLSTYTTHLMCVNFMHEWWRDLQFIGENFSCQFCLLSEFLLEIYIHTYIIGHYYPSARNTAYLLTLLMLCELILYVSGGIYSVTSTSNYKFFEKLFHGRIYRRRNNFFFSYFALIPDLGYEPWLYI